MALSQTRRRNHPFSPPSPALPKNSSETFTTPISFTCRQTPTLRKTCTGLGSPRRVAREDLISSW
ncbi:hypothetical protein BDQ12DRAFT_688148 [Crucibulum laeve]|uniref:Uncharacterized protein n=1 Tax=Crucibulum laeve TaxID=68775 RepID=A0A5C3LRD1_9AGAR|nr:hypothetical protein BDQ12DRAFT_688148 [Crucibulum laeve]